MTRPLLPLLLCLFAVACLQPARQQTRGDIVQAVHFQGNGGFLSGHTDYQLRTQMAQGDTKFGLLLWPLMYFVEPQEFDQRLLLKDAYRLEIWYAHNGWFDARITGWEIRRIRRRKSFRAGVLDVTGMVSLGPASFYRDFDIVGMNRNSQVLANVILRTGEVQPGEQFNLDGVNYTRDMLLTRLRQDSYAYARVEPEIHAYPDEHAVDITLHVDQGIEAAFGEIKVQGNKRVPERMIRDILPIDPGEQYDISRLSDAQRELFDLGTFSVASVTADTSDPSREEVPIRVTLTESKFSRLRAGAGIEWDIATFTPTVSTSFRRLNIARRLIRFDADARAGYAYSLDGSGIGSDGQAIYELGTGLTIPRFLDPKLTLTGSARLEQELFSGQFLARNPQVTSRLSYELTKRVLLQLGGGWEVFDLLDLSDAAIISAQTTFGEGFTDSYRLTTMDTRFTYDSRDDPLSPSRGELYQLTLLQSLPLAPEDYLFSEIDVDLRAYRKFGFSRRSLPFVLAGRIAGEYMQPWGDSALPYPELSFLGGGSGNRGFRLNQMGPYTCLCTYNGIPGDEGVEAIQRYLPEGGRAGATVSTELRYSWAYDISFAGFVDMSMLLQELSELGADQLRIGTGVGMRYNSLVGPIRIDFGLRPLYPEDDGPNKYVRCSAEADRIPRAYDIFSQPVASRGGLSERNIPFAFNIFLAIGEAI